MVTFFCSADLGREVTKAFVFCEWKGLAYWRVVGVPGCRRNLFLAYKCSVVGLIWFMWQIQGIIGIFLCLVLVKTHSGSWLNSFSGYGRKFMKMNRMLNPTYSA